MTYIPGHHGILVPDLRVRRYQRGFLNSGISFWKAPGGGGPSNPTAASIWAKIGAWYPMQDTSLTTGAKIADAFSGSYPLTIPSATPGLSSVPGLVNNAIQSAGTGYAVASTNPVPGNLTAICILCWFKTTATATSRYFWGTWNGAGIQLTSGSSSATAIRALLSAGGTQIITSSSGIWNDGAWHLAILQWQSGSKIELYLDDMTTPNAASSSAITDTLLTLGGNLSAFGQYGGSSYWAGVLEQGAMLKSPLTATERAYVYNDGAGVSFAQLRSDAGH